MRPALKPVLSKPARTLVNKGVFLSEVDSIDARGVTGYNNQFGALHGELTLAVNAIGGTSLLSGTNKYIPARLVADVAARPQYYMIKPGANDLAGGDYATASDFTNTVLSIADSMKAVGSIVIIGGTLYKAASNTTHNTRLATSNPAIAAAVGGRIDGFADFNAIHRALAFEAVGPTASTSDFTAICLTYYDDADTHPGDTFHDYMTQVLDAEYKRLTSVPRTVSFSVAGATIAASTQRSLGTVKIFDLAWGETQAITLTGTSAVIKKNGTSVGTSTTGALGDYIEFLGTSSATNGGTVAYTATIGTVSHSATLTTSAPANTMIMNAADKNAALSVTGGGLTVSCAVDNQVPQLVRSTIPFTGKRYAEMTINSTQGVFAPSIGVCNSTASLSAEPGVGNSNGGGGGIFRDVKPSGTYSYAAVHPSPGDVIMLACDTTTHKIWMGRNGTWCPTTDPATGTNGEDITALANFYLCISLQRIDNVTVNTGGSAFAYTPPTGFSAMP